ncbi:hypothetical protein BO78DRAFT_148276 [Aspergillus sclerotiicarbonarius CBS 121057]|uniref:Uncharacterized protein n=1 Tax=Aspergillus sclerotiicarbonarius (strain CBS 121057 / IBT 28362) TaxID=1448318 RepID=A0A319EC32_ASPSB|nr:hypothetical protein BO78DRAFT_148276 [Aspergillus sclerotiicarbonarius CBS 121057]
MPVSCRSTPPPQHTMAYRPLPLSHHFHPVLFRLAMLEYPAVETQIIHNLPIPVTCSQWMLHGCMRVAVVAVSFLLIQVEHLKIPHLISTVFVLLARIVIAAVVAPTIIPASSMHLRCVWSCPSRTKQASRLLNQSSCIKKIINRIFYFVPAVMPSVSPSKPFLPSPHPRET